MFEKHVLDLEAVWLMATYVECVWFEKLKRNRTVKIEHIIGHLKMFPGGPNLVICIYGEII